MRTETITIYNFAELSEQAQENVINNFCDINVMSEWWELVYEDAKRIGLRIISFDLDRNRHADGNIILSVAEVCQNIFNEHGETCETYKTAERFMQEWQPVFNKYLETEEGEDVLLDMEQEFEKLLLEDYAIMLQKEYEYLTSCEAIIETIEANEYEFDEDGNLI